MIANLGLKCYWPEMGEKRPLAQIRATLGHYGKHYYLRTPMELKGRGIALIGVMKSESLTPTGQYMAGWNEYKVTSAAFELIKNNYAVSMEALL